MFQVLRLTQFAAAMALGAICIQAAANASSTLYISTTGSDTTGTGSISAPYATLTHAMGQATPGSVIDLRGGTYYMYSWIAVSGTASAPITIQSYPGEWAIIDGSKAANSDAVDIVANYITIQSLQVQNANGMGIYDTGSYSTFKDLTVTGAFGSGIRVDGQGEPNSLPSSDSIQNCTVYNDVRQNAPGSTYTGGWDSGIDVAKANNVSVSGNTVYDNYGEGIDVQASFGCYVGYNTCHDNFSVNIYGNTTTNTVIEGNTCTCDWYTPYYRNGEPAEGIELSNEWALPQPQTNNVTVRNNNVNYCYDAFSEWNGGAGGGQMENTSIYGNTFGEAIHDLVNINSGNDTGSALYNNTFITDWDDTISTLGTGLSVYGNTYEP